MPDGQPAQAGLPIRSQGCTSLAGLPSRSKGRSSFLPASERESMEIRADLLLKQTGKSWSRANIRTDAQCGATDTQNCGSMESLAVAAGGSVAPARVRGIGSHQRAGECVELLVDAGGHDVGFEFFEL